MCSIELYRLFHRNRPTGMFKFIRILTPFAKNPLLVICCAAVAIVACASKSSILKSLTATAYQKADLCYQ